MITLEEAFALTNIIDDEVVTLRAYPVGTHSGRIIATRKKIEETVEFGTVKVHWIGPWFVCGEYEGFEFAVSGMEIADNSTTAL